MCEISRNEKIITDFKNGDNISTLEKKYGGSRKTLRKILFDSGLIDSIESTRKCYFRGQGRDELKEQVLLKYKNEKDLIVLANEFKIPITSIYSLLRKEKVFDPKYGKIFHNERVRKYPVDEHFFDVIDTEEKAYFLGILYADGTNSLKKCEIKLSLQEDDYEILEKLNKLFQPTKPILIGKGKREPNRKEQYRLIINSKILSYRLNDLGVVPNKTFKVTYPEWMPDHLHRHFIRGYFDGDGCVTFNKANQYLILGLTGTENMMLGIQNILIQQAGFNKVKLSTRFPERHNNTRSLSYSGNGNARKLYKFLYNDTTIYMVRKKNKFDKHLTF